MRNVFTRIPGRLQDWLRSVVGAVVKRKHEVAIAGILLGALVAALSSPTIKSVRTVELDPKRKIESPQALVSGVALTNSMVVPSHELAYALVWVKDVHNSDRLTSDDYASVTLEIIGPDGQGVRTATRPALIKREGEPALLFAFDTAATQAGQRYTFVLKQMGDGTVWVHHPLPDQIRDGETVTTSFQLGEKRNWITLLVEKVYDEDFTGHDISSYFHRGRQIVGGLNPYSCTLSKGDSCIGYPAHLPGMYLLTAGFVALGVDNLEEWAQAWRPFSFAAWFGVGMVLFVYIFRLGQPALAVAALGFWLFNRWSVQVLRIAHTDFLGTLLLVLAVLLANRWPWWAALLLGVSLSIKQVAILVVPLFLIVVWRSGKVSAAKFGGVIGLLLLVPLAVAAPFLVNDAPATLKGLSNIAERPSQVVHGFAPSIDVWLDVTDMSRSFIMLLLIGCIYIAAWRKTVGLISGTLMVLVIMIAFINVLYNQYFVWLIPFILLAAATLRADSKTAVGQPDDAVRTL